MQVWNKSAKFYVPEIARSTFVMARVLGESGHCKEAAAMLKDAASLREKIPWAPKVDVSLLTEADFDTLVMYWSR